MVEKSYDSAAGDQYLKQLNKVSHKISKPIKKNPFDHYQQQHQQQSPPVYNINKSDFRDVVQKLTGSPAHDSTAAAPPLIHLHKPQTSRLHSIRPPPLAQVSTKPPLLPLNDTSALPRPFASTTSTTNIMNNNNENERQILPLSPLPPFPTVNLAAESPISAYMRYLRSSTSTVEPSLKNPNLLTQQQPQPQPLQIKVPSLTSSMGQSQICMPNSPLSSGKIPSPKSPYPLLSSPSSFLFSPTTAQLGFHQLPPSLSPSWRNLFN